ncbi:MAG: hypothetical protein A3E37_03430 [Candidatus Andersenbacteria bacterium RIFCSPHIGHO2_12_FULL_46_9]|nr:MAG: Transcriptional regulator, TrmB [Parcubacteria group bacterium GW2011_GWA2_45_14]OGY35138.1 MAG: hypothetical protein A3B76_05575 [Candidatus Andersenbacteria bacterium RIFCSPHIGHO2_02_FULL_46_16]OGY37752.1 MAG: hypothetical protein A3E37_03430 [Candidatus Andersenbacteria bacterium RIFCSPHIGHO2_12_FULL_46_9]HBE90036.1 hypothetical protein [Candidatus Andersenbacteria bacterium]
MELATVLEQAGLTKKQAVVYLATLELGRVSVGHIAYKAGIKRPTTYVILAELQQAGLIEVIPRGTTTLYQAMDPALILERLNRQTALFKDTLPQLRAILNVAETKPKVRFYEGKQGIYNLYANEILRQKEFFSLVNLAAFAKVYSEQDMIQLLERMKESQVKTRELIESSPAARWYIKEKDSRQLGETRMLTSDFKFTVDFVVYGNKLATISLKNLVAVVIEDAAISQAQLQLLEFLWSGAKK